MRHKAHALLPYSAKFSQVFNFANFTNFANFQLFGKIFQQKFLTRSVRYVHAASSRNEIAIRENLDPRKFSAIQYSRQKYVDKEI